MISNCAYRYCVLLVGAFGLSSGSWAAADAVGQNLQQGPTFSVSVGGAQPTGTSDPAVYDSFTTATGLTTTTGVPRSVMGGGFSAAGAGPQVDISKITVYMAATTAVAYSNIRVNIQLWDTAAAASTPVFGSAAGSLIVADLGAVSTTANTFNAVDVTLSPPVRLNSLASKGIAVSYQGDSGSGLATTDALTSLMTYGAPVSVGTNSFNGGNGFLRNASLRTDYNFLPSDLRTFSGITDVGFGVILYGNASVPVTLQSYSVD